MNLAEHLPVLAIAIPLAGASITFVIGGRRAPFAGLAVAGLNALVTVLLVARVLDVGPMRYAIGGWQAPLGIVLAADGLSSLFLLLTAVVGTVITVYATWYMRPTDGDEGPGHGLFWTLWLILWASLNALLLSGDVFNVYVCLELVGISAVALVTLAEGGVALRAGLRYMFASIMGAMTYLLGVTLLYSDVGTLDMASLRGVLGGTIAAPTGLALMVAALVLKTALVPVHFWLPSAHSAAPTPVSAALSALVVKGSFFVLLRLFVDVMPPDYLGHTATLLGMLGAAAIVWGSILAAKQVRLKMLVAYSTVAQIGYLFLVFPLVKTGGPALATAIAGVVVHVLAHGVAKSAMFLTAGGFLTRYGTDEIGGLRGAARATPVLAFSFALAGVTMMGLPPSGGFGAKWLVVSAYLQTGQWWWAAVPVVGGLLAAVYIFRVVRITMADSQPEIRSAESTGRVEWLPFGLAAISVVLVLAVPFVMRLLGTASAVSGVAVMPL